MTPAVEQATERFMQVANRIPILYDLGEEWNRLIALLEDPEADQIEVQQELARVAGDIRRKGGGIAAVLSGLSGLVEHQDNDIKRLQAKKKANEAHIERLKAYTLSCLQNIGLERLETGTFTLAVAKNPPSVEVFDASMVPHEFERTKISVEVDKRAILDAFKRDGDVVPGTRVVRTESLRIS